MRRRLVSAVCLISLALPGLNVAVMAQQESGLQMMDYPATFFDKYQPTTALDMVRQLPGFQLDDGDNSRGFGAAAGNILVNNRRPSAKQTSSSSILARIPAGQVRHIELIQGQARGIDMRGRAVIANVLLHENAPAAVQWSTYIMHSTTSGLKPGLNVSVSDRWNNIEYNAGLDIEGAANGEYGPERVFDGEGNLVESRFDDELESGVRLRGLTLTATRWMGETLFQVNGKAGLANGPQERLSIRQPVIPADRMFSMFFKDSQTNPSFELGADAERSLDNDLMGKLILLYTYRSSDQTSLQSVRNPDGVEILQRIADSETLSKEAISRLEFDWSALPDHAVQFNLEAAYNSLDGALVQTVDSGGGPVVIDVPGSNTRVEEIRGDFLLKDTWVSGKFELDIGLGAETSTISQSGDEDQKRNFFFLKPEVAFSYSPDPEQQFRFRAAREIAQLDFNDFISATVFGDDNLALGNPNLRPDKTWTTELAYEYRFAQVGVIKFRGFYHWINDVLDLLPLTATDAVPGNIGDGWRRGLEVESTLALDWLGLAGSKLDLKARWQDSAVTDPATGVKRPLSARAGFSGPPAIQFRNGNRYVYDIAYRQDFNKIRIAWGWNTALQAERPLFKVNELDTYNEELLVNAFIETTRWFDIKIRIEGTNLLNYIESRDRILYSGSRDISPIDIRILRERNSGRRISLSFSGNF